MRLVQRAALEVAGEADRDMEVACMAVILSGMFKVQHPLDSELIGEHAEARAPEHVLP